MSKNFNNDNIYGEPANQHSFNNSGFGTANIVNLNLILIQFRSKIFEDFNNNAISNRIGHIFIQGIIMGLNNLEELIYESYSIVVEYEKILQTSNRPKEKMRAKREIEEQWVLIKSYLLQYTPACNNLGADVPNKIKEISLVADTKSPSPINQEILKSNLNSAKGITSQPKTLPSEITTTQIREFGGKFNLSFSKMTEKGGGVILHNSAMGEANSNFDSPFTDTDLVSVLKALESLIDDVGLFNEKQIKSLVELNLWSNNDLVPIRKLYQRIGKRLFDSLIKEGRIREAFEIIRWKAQNDFPQSALLLRLCFDHNAVEFARYPWELIFDGHHHLLLSREVNLVRYINYHRPPRTVSLTPPLKMLYIISRPVDLPTISKNEERSVVRKELQGLVESGYLTIEDLHQPTYHELAKFLEAQENRINILHFDGHGTFARICPNKVCKEHNYSHLQNCAKCGKSLKDVDPLGYLAFETDSNDKRAKWISGERLGSLLHPFSISLVFLSSCSSATIRGESVFGGVAPSLIQAGIPAVVATQLPMSIANILIFVEGFYSALAQFKCIPDAVNQGRRLIEDHEWFIPALYLRDKDDYGCLFKNF